MKGRVISCLLRLAISFLTSRIIMIAIAHTAIGIADEILCDALRVVDAYLKWFHTTRRVGSSLGFRIQLAFPVTAPSAKAPSWTIITIICAISPIPVICTPIISRLRAEWSCAIVDCEERSNDRYDANEDYDEPIARNTHLHDCRARPLRFPPLLRVPASRLLSPSMSNELRTVPSVPAGRARASFF